METLHPVRSSMTDKEKGLSEGEVLARQKQYGLNIVHKRKINILTIFLRQFSGNPLIIILALATFISFALGQRTSSYYIFGLIIVSVSLGLWDEYSAEKTVDNLLKKISSQALVIRGGERKEIPVTHVTVGDIVLLAEGSIISADMTLIDGRDLEVDEAALTGESKSVIKNTEKNNQLFMGTNVVSGSATAVVTKIGKDTEFGKIAKTTTYLKPVTDFQKGLSTFGTLIVKVIFVLTIAIFVINAMLGHNLLNSLLFSLAIAVGLTPELLPVIVTVSLSHGAGKLAKKHLVAKRLIAIENLGNMDILCTDKTGTLTEGKIHVVDHVNKDGKSDTTILIQSLLCNSAIVHHKVLGNAIDVSLWEYAMEKDITLDKAEKKVEEEPFDYAKKAMYCVVEKNGKRQLIVKGAPEAIFGFCKTKEKTTLIKKFAQLNSDGLRIIVCL